MIPIGYITMFVTTKAAQNTQKASPSAKELEVGWPSFED